MAIWVHSSSFIVHSCDLVFVANNTALVGDGNAYFGCFVQYNTLAGQATFEAWIEGAVNEIFFLVGYFLDKILPLFYINMAGRAGANTAAVVIQVNVAFFRDLQNRHILETSRHRLWTGHFYLQNGT